MTSETIMSSISREERVDDEPQDFRELAEAAIMDLRRYANDELPHRRLVSAEAYEARFAQLSAALSPNERLDDQERSFVWKWIERAIFDDQIRAADALAVLANYPGAPWKTGTWDVSHKPYSAKFYEQFPKARALSTTKAERPQGTSHDQ